MTDNASESVEMYLKSLAELGGDRDPVPIGRVAERLGVSPVSANEMMKRLGQQGLVEHLPYKGVSLTPDGRTMAHSVIRRQRLWECFLVDHLKLDWAVAYDQACDLEHATGPAVVEALADYLGQPSTCPHGNPIPGPDGQVVPAGGRSLAELAIGQSGLVRAIMPETGEVLGYLGQRGIRPGQKVTVLESAPLQGPLTVRAGDETIVLGLNLATLVLVDEVEQ